jgi:hypothetical protein
MYFQELRAHQTVWGSAEIHPDHGDPGLVTTNGAFSLLASLGISSIPFREYLVHPTSWKCCSFSFAITNHMLCIIRPRAPGS